MDPGHLVEKIVDYLDKRRAMNLYFVLFVTVLSSFIPTPFLFTFDFEYTVLKKGRQNSLFGFLFAEHQDGPNNW